MAMNREALPAESELSEQAGSLYVVPNAPELPEEIYQPSHGEHVSYNHDDIPELHPELLLKHRLGRVGRFLGKAALVGSIFVASGTAGMMIEGAPITVGPLHGNAKFTFDSYSSATFHDTQEHSATSVGLPFKAPSPLDGVGLGVHASLPNPLISITPTGIEPKIRDEKELKQKAALFANADQDVKADVWKMKEF